MRGWTRGRLGRITIRLLVWPLILYAMFRWFEYKQVYQPSKHLEASGADLRRPWEDIHFQSSDHVALNGWWFPADRHSARKGTAILICHGNGGNISHRLGTCRTLLDLGLAVFVFDYRGYGLSAGRPSEEGTYRDAEAAYDWLLAKGFAPDKIILYGESLGGAVATELALRRSVLGLILVSTFESIPAVGSELFPWLPVNYLCTINYATLSKVPRLKIPLLIMHSRADSIIRYQHGERLFAAANQPKTLWEIYGDHNDALLAGPERCQDGIRRFLDSLDQAVPGPG